MLHRLLVPRVLPRIVVEGASWIDALDAQGIVDIGRLHGSPAVVALVQHMLAMAGSARPRAISLHGMRMRDGPRLPALRRRHAEHRLGVDCANLFMLQSDIRGIGVCGTSRLTGGQRRPASALTIGDPLRASRGRQQ